MCLLTSSEHPNTKLIAEIDFRIYVINVLSRHMLSSSKLVGDLILKKTEKKLLVSDQYVTTDHWVA
jgi:hypothetical protein